MTGRRTPRCWRSGTRKRCCAGTPAFGWHRSQVVSVNLVRTDRKLNGVSLSLVRDLGMTGLFGPSAVTYCADLVPGLVSAEDVGDSGLRGNNVVLGEVDVDNSSAGPRFVTVTAVTARGHRVPFVLAQRAAQLPEPSRYQLRRRWPSGPVILVTPGAAPSGGLTCNAAFAGPTCVGCRWVATRWECSARGCSGR